MKRILLIILMLATTAKAQPFMSVPQSSTISFSVDTLGSTGTLTAADNSPWFGIFDYVNSGTTALATGTFNAGTTAVGNAGHYYGTLSLNSSTYTVGRLYTIEAVGTVSGVVGGKTVAYVYVLPAQTTSGYNLVDARSSTGTAAGSQGGLMLIGANSGTHSFSGAATYTGGVDTATLTANRFSITNGISAASFSPGIGTFTNLETGTLTSNRWVVTNGIAASTLNLSGGATVAGFTSTGSLHLGSVTIDSAVTVGGTLTVIGPINAATFNTSTFNVGAGSWNLGSFNFGNATFGNAAISTLNVSAGTFLINRFNAGSSNMGNMTGTFNMRTNVP